MNEKKMSKELKYYYNHRKQILNHYNKNKKEINKHRRQLYGEKRVFYKPYGARNTVKTLIVNRGEYLITF